MSKVTLTTHDIYQGNLILVNHMHPCKKELSPVQLRAVFEHQPQILMETRAGAILRKLLDTLSGQDSIVAVSGFRSPQLQEKIYKSAALHRSAEFAQNYVALPNHSEHQTGLAIDLAQNKPDIDFICPDFPDIGICGAFGRAAPRFGFIERYPQGKQALTGIAPEPWHFRYVGFPHSLIMQANCLTLEEYIDSLRAFPFEINPLFYSCGGTLIEIGYVSLSEKKK